MFPELTPLLMEEISAAASESFTLFSPTYLLCVDPTDVFNRLWAIQGSIHLFETRSICSSILVGRSVIGNIRSRFLFNLCCNVRKQKVKIWNYWFLFLDYVFFFFFLTKSQLCGDPRRLDSRGLTDRNSQCFTSAYSLNFVILSCKFMKQLP